MSHDQNARTSKDYTYQQQSQRAVEAPATAEPGSSKDQGPGGEKKKSSRSRAKKCPVHTEYDVLFHCHACDLDICKLCWKLGHTGTKERHHNVVFIEFKKQKEFAEQIDAFNLEDRLSEIDYQSKLCDKTSSHLRALIEKLHQEKANLQEEVAVCDKLISNYGKLQSMARASNFDHTNADVKQFMALTDNPYDTRDPIFSENDKEALEGLIEEIYSLVLDRSPESSAAVSTSAFNASHQMPFNPDFPFQ